MILVVFPGDVVGVHLVDDSHYRRPHEVGITYILIELPVVFGNQSQLTGHVVCCVEVCLVQELPPDTSAVLAVAIVSVVLHKVVRRLLHGLSKLDDFNLITIGQL